MGGQKTQEEFARAVGYSREQIGHLETGRRLPDITSIAALFAPALGINDDTVTVASLVDLAAKARNEAPPDRITHTKTTETRTRTSFLEGESPGAARQHREAAQWAEMAEGDVIKAAREYALAGDIKAAADVLTDQGAMLSGHGKAFEAADVVDAILALIDAQPNGRATYTDTVCRLLSTRGDALIHTARAEEAERDYRAASELASGAVRANLIYRLSGCMAQSGRAVEAVAMARQTLDELPPHLSLIRAQLLVMESSGLIGLARYAEAERSAREVVTLAEALTPVVPLVAAGIRARGNNMLGALHAMRQDLQPAIAYWRATIDTARLAGIRSLEYRAQGNIAAASLELGDLNASAEACAQALEGLRQLGDQHGAARSLHLSATLAYMRGDVVGSIAQAEAACAAKQQIGDTASLALSRAQLGKSLLGDRQLDRAADALRTSLAEAEQAGNQRIGAYAAQVRAEVEIAQGDAAGAEARCRAALALSVVRQDVKLEDDLKRTLAIALFARNDDAQARDVLASSSLTNPENVIEQRLVAAMLALNSAERDETQRNLISHADDAQTRGYALSARRARELREAMADGSRVRALEAVLMGGA